MKSLVWTAPSLMEIQDQPVPALAPDEVLIRVAFGGICGSELSGYLGHNALRVPPLVMGHEFSGEIAAVGAGVAPDDPALTVGRPVTVNPLYCADPAEVTARGLEHLCASRRLIGAHRPGAYAEYVAVPARTVVPLPTGLGLREGALSEPVGCAVRIGELVGQVAEETCLIVGAGPIGLLTLQVLLLNGAQRVFVSDRDGERLKMASALGGDVIDPNQQDVVEVVRGATGKRGAFASVDAVGTAATREQCVRAVRTTGTVILSGLHEETSAIPAADIIRREITLRGSFAYSPANFLRAVELLANKQIGLDPWIVEAPLEEGGNWFDRLINKPGGVSKVLLKP